MKKPCVPHNPKGFPKTLMLYSPFKPVMPPSVEYGAPPPIWIAKPHTQKANNPKPYTIKFIIMVWFAFLARVRPVSTTAKPACMNMTRKPAINVHTKLIAIRFWPA